MTLFGVYFYKLNVLEPCKQVSKKNALLKKTRILDFKVRAYASQNLFF